MRYDVGRFRRPMRRSTEGQMMSLISLGDGSTLTLDFTTGQLDPRLTFSRTSNATFINSGGLVEWAAANMMTRSQSQDNNSYWNAFGTSVTRAANQSDPLGGTGAVKLDYDATSADAVISRVVTVSQGLTYTLSVWLRADSGTVNNVRLGRGASAAGAFFPSLTTSWQRFSLTFVATGGSDGIELRVLTSGSPKTASFHVFGAQLEPGSTMRDYNPALLDVPYHAPRFDHDPTTLAPRGLLIEGSANNLVFRSQSLNTSPWNKPAAVSVSETGSGSPANDNTSNVVTWTNSTGGGSAWLEQSITVSGSQPYTWSVWLKQRNNQRVAVFGLARNSGGSVIGNIETTVNFSVSPPTVTNTVTSGYTSVTTPTLTEYPNGWYRMVVTGTTPATATTTTFGISNKDAVPATGTNGCEVWGAQLEAGSGASSYIPTGASTVTRNVDQCTMPTSSFITGPLYPHTLFVDCIPSTPSGAFVALCRLFDRTAGGTFSYGTEIYYYNAATMTAQRKISASTNTDRNFANGLSYGSRHKFAVSVDSASFLGSYDGVTGLGATTAPAALPTVATHLGVGCDGQSSPSAIMFGTIRQIKFWPFALPQATINALTTL